MNILERKYDYDNFVVDYQKYYDFDAKQFMILTEKLN